MENVLWYVWISRMIRGETLIHATFNLWQKFVHSLTDSNDRDSHNSSIVSDHLTTSQNSESKTFYINRHRSRDKLARYDTIMSWPHISYFQFFPSFAAVWTPCYALRALTEWKAINIPKELAPAAKRFICLSWDSRGVKNHSTIFFRYCRVRGKGKHQ